MAHFMKLELKKIHFKNYIFISVLSILMTMFFTYVSLNDTSFQAHTFEDTFRTVTMVFAFIFIIFFSVLNVSIVINEYTNKTIFLMFSYPVEKKKILAAKLLVITGFIALSLLVGYVFCFLFILGIDQQLDLIAGDFSPSFLADFVKSAVYAAIVFCCLGLWTFALGMIKKSATVTIVSSVVFIFLRQIVITSLETPQETFPLVLVTVGLTAVFLWFTFERNIGQLD